MTRHAAVIWLAIAAIPFGGGGCGSGKAAPPAERPTDVFPVMPWELPLAKERLLDEPGHGIQSLRACGFNTVAFVRPDQLAEVAKAGMHAIVGRPSDHRVNWRALSDRAISTYVEKLVRAAGKSDALLGYFLADEPSAADFPALAKAVAAVERLAPGKLAYVNLYPSYAPRSQLGARTYARYLERYVTEVEPQFISYDNYDVVYSRDLADSARAAEYFANLLQVRGVATQHGLPFWEAVASTRIRASTPVPSPANLRAQAYTALAAGAHGLNWFTYYAGRYGHAPIDRAGRRTATWSYLKRVNDQVEALIPILTHLRTTGVFFTPGFAGGLPKLPGRLIRSAAAPTPVMVGELSGRNGERYALVVNLSLRRAAKVVVKGRARSIERVSTADRSPTPLSHGSLWLAAGQGALLKLPPRIRG